MNAVGWCFVKASISSVIKNSFRTLRCMDNSGQDDCDEWTKLKKYPENPRPPPSSPLALLSLLLPPSLLTPHHPHNHHHQPFFSDRGWVNCSENLWSLAMADLAGSDTGGARRRRERRLRSWAKHERLSVAMALAEAIHHSACFFCS